MARCDTCIDELQLNNDGASCWSDTALEALAYPIATREALSKMASLNAHDARLVTALAKLGNMIAALKNNAMSREDDDRFFSISRMLFNAISADLGSIEELAFGGNVSHFFKNVSEFMKNRCGIDIGSFDGMSNNVRHRIAAGSLTIVNFKRMADPLKTMLIEHVVAVSLTMPSDEAGLESHAITYVRCNDDPNYWLLADGYTDESKTNFINTAGIFRGDAFNPVGDGVLDRYTVRYGAVLAVARSVNLYECSVVYATVQEKTRSAWGPKIKPMLTENGRDAIMRHFFGIDSPRDLKTAAVAGGWTYVDAATASDAAKAAACSKVCMEVTVRSGHVLLLALERRAPDDDVWAVYDERSVNDYRGAPAICIRTRKFDIFNTNMWVKPLPGVFNIYFYDGILGVVGTPCAYKENST